MCISPPHSWDHLSHQSRGVPSLERPVPLPVHRQALPSLGRVYQTPTHWGFLAPPALDGLTHAGGGETQQRSAPAAWPCRASSSKESFFVTPRGQLQDPHSRVIQEAPSPPKTQWLWTDGAHLSAWVPPQQVCCLGIPYTSTGQTALSLLLTESAKSHTRLAILWDTRDESHDSGVHLARGNLPRCVEGPSEPCLGARNQRAHCHVAVPGNPAFSSFLSSPQPCSDRSGAPNLSSVTVVCWSKWREETGAGARPGAQGHRHQVAPLLLPFSFPVFSPSWSPEAEGSPQIPDLHVPCCCRSLSDTPVFSSEDPTAPADAH